MQDVIECVFFSLLAFFHIALLDHVCVLVWEKPKETQCGVCVCMYSILYVCMVCDCGFVACDSGTPQAVRLSSSSLSKKQGAPSGRLTPPLSPLRLLEVCVCARECIAFSVTCTHVCTFFRLFCLSIYPLYADTQSSFIGTIQLYIIMF